jgi:D-alanyl-D-alanine carboxypeptidase
LDGTGETPGIRIGQREDQPSAVTRRTAEDVVDPRPMRSTVRSPDDLLMPPRPLRTVALPLVVAVVFVAGAMAWPRTATSGGSTADPPTTSTVASAVDVPAEHRGAPAEPVRPAPGPEDRGASAVADGAAPDHMAVSSNEFPGVANLDVALLGALRRAAIDAGGAGVTFYVDSGWRSPAYQERLFRQAVSKYGSEREAARWVATPETSAHVSGDAVDIGPPRATAWLSKHGSRFGLCQIYRNEPWHYELRPDAIRHGCPTMYADPTDDPRMHP